MTTRNSLSVTLPAEDQILITRQFAAPRHLVYRAWTEPELIKRWWAGDRGQVTSVQVDLRIGGTWRFVMSASSGFEAAFHGEYLELVPNRRIVSTEVFEAVPDATAVNTITFAEQHGRTTLDVLVQHASKAARDMHLNSGMEGGLRSSLDHLEQVVHELR